MGTNDVEVPMKGHLHLPHMWVWLSKQDLLVIHDVHVFHFRTQYACFITGHSTDLIVALSPEQVLSQDIPPGCLLSPEH